MSRDCSRLDEWSSISPKRYTVAFGDKALANLTYAIGLMNAFNRFGIAFRSTPAAVANL
jgi:hypothetical protein